MHFEVLDKHQKRYPHFDKPLSKNELEKIVNDPKRVAKNAFFPLIQYEKQYQPFRSKPSKPSKKIRKIRYASRRDSIIFSAYRHLLSDKYEKRLIELGIEDIPIAYRRIPLHKNSTRGKCNFDFANDLFTEIKLIKRCTVFALDISSFFESIDHKRLYQVWCDLIDVDNLPEDHLSVYKAVTRYAFVDRTDVYKRLGIIEDCTSLSGITKSKYLKKFKEMPVQLCTPLEFRQKIAGGIPEFSSLIQTNPNCYGIPQGAPISDLLANSYLLDFDVELAKIIEQRGGRYWRYSDDIAILLPGNKEANSEIEDIVSNLIKEYGSELKIKKEKTIIEQFDISSGVKQTNGIEYLGFRFDGEYVYLRNSTLSNFYRKIKKAAKKQARVYVARYTGKDQEWLLNNFDYSQFEKKFGRVKNFDKNFDRKNWTFWTYVKRASNCFGENGRPILKQVRNYRTILKMTVESEIKKQLGDQNNSQN